MTFNKCLIQLVSSSFLLLLLHLSAANTIPQWDQFCQIDDTTSLICYVHCFEDILGLLPKEANFSLIRSLFVRQTFLDCNIEAVADVFNRFTGLREFHFTGVICPFTTPTNISNLNQMTITSLAETHIDGVQNIRKIDKQTLLPNLEKLEIREMCCNLFQGNIVAPRLEDFSFKCTKVPSYITGLNGSRNYLHFTTPHLKKLKYFESGLGFPISSVANLTELNTLFISPNVEYSEIFLPGQTRLNLSSLKELIFTSEEYGLFSTSHYFQCVDLGDTNLTQVVLLYPSPGSLTCPSVWRCISCHPDASNDNQTVNVYVKSSSYTKLSSLLPNLLLNTTDLSFNHSPLLHIDDEAMSRFSHLRSLQVGETYGNAKQAGMVVLLNNPFKSLPRPDEFRFLRLFLVECGCLAYDTFAWLRTKSAQFDGAIQCSEVLQALSAEERIDVGQWINISEFMRRLERRCRVPPFITPVNPPTADRLFIPTTLKATDCSDTNKSSLFICAIILYFILDR
ncbi:hypothetical protein Aperf_G00000078554 [Anoplocephala perfoliata]